MEDRRPVEKHTLAGLLMLLTGVFLPGLLMIAAALVPSLEWIQGPEWGTGLVGRIVIAAIGALLCVASYGFIVHQAWAWWIMAAWGLLAAVTLAIDALNNPFAITISVPQIIAVFFIAYIFRKRRDFGVLVGADRP